MIKYLIIGLLLLPITVQAQSVKGEMGAEIINPENLESDELILFCFENPNVLMCDVIIQESIVPDIYTPFE